MRLIVVRLSLLFSAMFTSALALSEEQPLWEVGAGVGALVTPAYRGSDEIRNFVMPVPYFIYRGDIFKADRDGVRGSLFESERIELMLSLSGSPPIDSDELDLREDMPDLKTTVEIGPRIDLALWRSHNNSRSLELRLPARAGFTVEDSPESVGWVFAPSLNLDITDLSIMPGWDVGLKVGPIYASAAQHDYFYGVEEEYATDTRPAYQADAGYSGSQFLLSLSKRFDHTRIGAFLRYDTLSGAAFEESPLVTERRFAAVGFIVAWVIKESKSQVWVDD